MGTPDNTAQAHPELFTRGMAQLAEERGVRIVTGARVTAVNKSRDGRAVESVAYVRDGKEEEALLLLLLLLPTTHCVVAAGPWTPALLPGVPVSASRVHSVVVKAPNPLSAYALFTSIALPPGFPGPAGKTVRRAQVVEPEVYARPDGTAYACGPPDSNVPLPATSPEVEVEVDVARCQDIINQVAGISDDLGKDGKVVARQACYLPQGGPFIGHVGGTKGLIVASGHTCWGIQNAPGTGKLVSELILDGAVKSARLGSCDPSRIL